VLKRIKAVSCKRTINASLIQLTQQTSTEGCTKLYIPSHNTNTHFSFHPHTIHPLLHQKKRLNISKPHLSKTTSANPTYQKQHHHPKGPYVRAATQKRKQPPPLPSSNHQDTTICQQILHLHNVTFTSSRISSTSFVKSQFFLFLYYTIIQITVSQIKRYQFWTF
jgi:hypothetical protein